MDAREIAQRRLASQRLSGEPLRSPAEVVRYFGAVQAQEYPVARWSVGQRTRGFHDADVRRAVDSGEIVRLHALRPTWHFVAAEDVSWIQALTAARVNAAATYYARQRGIDDALVAKVNAAILTALEPGKPLTRVELTAVLAEAGIDASGDRMGHLLLRSELDGLVGSGPMRGKQHTYRRLDPGPPMEPDAALVELIRRYFTSHGPATVKDFAWWSSLRVSEIRRGIEQAGLESSSVDRRVFYSVPGEPAGAAGIHVLPSYDEYLVAYSESRGLMNIAGLDVGTKGLTLFHAIVRDSQVIGVWKRIVRPDGITIEPSLGVRLTGVLRRAVDAAFARYGAFAGVPVTITWP
jgi:hypothetical protein